MQSDDDHTNDGFCDLDAYPYDVSEIESSFLEQEREYRVVGPGGLAEHINCSGEKAI